ncbi:MAG: hypothetical protein ACFFC0_03070, partial [Promethearchaeota archaeon]
MPLGHESAAYICVDSSPVVFEVINATCLATTPFGIGVITIDGMSIAGKACQKLGKSPPGCIHASNVVTMAAG